MWQEKNKIKEIFPKLSNIDMTYFFETKLSNIGHFFQNRHLSVKLVDIHSKNAFGLSVLEKHTECFIFTTIFVESFTNFDLLLNILSL